MNRGTLFRGAIIFVCLWVGIVLVCVQESLAQFGRISISASAGAGCLPLADWKDFATNISSSHFNKDKFGSYLDFRVTYHLTSKHALAISVEDIKTSASLYQMEFLTGATGDTIGYASSVIEWDFKATPVSISYEFYPTRSGGEVSPFLGVGASYFFSTVKSKLFEIHNTLFENMREERTRNGEGYGSHLYVGVQSQLTRHLQVVSRLRGRYADGMGFTDKKGDIKVEFTGVDFTLGIGWRF